MIRRHLDNKRERNNTDAMYRAKPERPAAAAQTPAPPAPHAESRKGKGKGKGQGRGYGYCLDFYNKGSCKRGINCPYPHVKNLTSDPSKQPFCRDYAFSNDCKTASCDKRHAPMCARFVSDRCPNGQDCALPRMSDRGLAPTRSPSVQNRGRSASRTHNGHRKWSRSPGGNSILPGADSDANAITYEMFRAWVHGVERGQGAAVGNDARVSGKGTKTAPGPWGSDCVAARTCMRASQ